MPMQHGCSIAYNLFALMRMVLPNWWSTARAPTVRLRLYDVAAQIVRHAKQWTVKVNAYHRQMIDEALRIRFEAFRF